MYISISKIDLSNIGGDAIVCIDETSNRMKKWLERVIIKTNANVKIIYEKFNRDQRLSPKDEYIVAFESAVKKAADNKYKAIAIPVVSDAYTLSDEAILSLIQDTINADYDFLLKGIYERVEYPEQIILYVDNDVMYKNLHKVVRRKKNWSQVRKLSYILDLLDLRLNWKEIKIRHFLDLKNYRKYFNEFIRDERVKNELIKKTYVSYSDCCNEIDEFVEQLNDLRFKYLNMSNKCKKALNTYFTKEFHIDPKLKNSFTDLIYNTEPLFPYIKHLVPDKEWKHTHIKNDNDYAVNKIDEIKSYHNELVLLLKKIKSLEDTFLPLHLLKNYWDSELWNNVMDSDPRAIETQVKKALALRYDSEVHYIEEIIWRDSK